VTATLTGTSVTEKVGISHALSGATLNIGTGANITTNFFTISEAANATGGVVNQTDGTVNVVGQFRAGHFGTETSTYNMSGGSLTLTGTSPTVTPSTSGAGAANATGDNNINGGATATIHGGGIYLGIDGTGIFNQSGGTVTTNWIVLDNRGDTAAGTNMPDGVDRYNLSGSGILNIRSNYGLIGRNTSTAVSFAGGTVRVDNGGNGTGTGANITIPLDANITVSAPGTTLDTNGAGNGFSLNRNVIGAGTLTLTGGGTVNLTTTGTQVVTPSLTTSGAGVNLAKTRRGRDYPNRKRRGIHWWRNRVRRTSQSRPGNGPGFPQSRRRRHHQWRTSGWRHRQFQRRDSRVRSQFRRDANHRRSRRERGESAGPQHDSHRRRPVDRDHLRIEDRSRFVFRRQSR
jgi:hypothetical protein